MVSGRCLFGPIAGPRFWLLLLCTNRTNRGLGKPIVFSNQVKRNGSRVVSMNVLIVYASVEGHTLKIAHFLRALVQRTGREATLVDAGEKAAPAPLGGVDKTVIVAPIHRQRHPARLEKYLRANKHLLNQHQTLFLSVSLCAAFPEGLDEAHSYVAELKERTGFSAKNSACIAGALQFSKYHDYEAQVVRLIGLHLKQYEATKLDHEFTDWPALETTVSGFLAT